MFEFVVFDVKAYTFCFKLSSTDKEINYVSLWMKPSTLVGIYEPLEHVLVETIFRIQLWS